MSKSIFVFGSNLSGIHGAGAAKVAYQHHGAKWGVGEGMAGNSYALPTKGYRITFMPLWQVVCHIEKFLNYARNNQDKTFQVTCVGCGLAGFKDSEIASIFKSFNPPKNCHFDSKWQPYLGDEYTYWGTY